MIIEDSSCWPDKDDENCPNSNLDVKFDGDYKKCKNKDGGNDGDGSERIPYTHPAQYKELWHVVVV